MHSLYHSMFTWRFTFWTYERNLKTNLWEQLFVYCFYFFSLSLSFLNKIDPCYIHWRRNSTFKHCDLPLCTENECILEKKPRDQYIPCIRWYQISKKNPPTRKTSPEKFPGKFPSSKLSTKGLGHFLGSLLVGSHWGLREDPSFNHSLGVEQYPSWTAENQFGWCGRYIGTMGTHVNPSFIFRG